MAGLEDSLKLPEISQEQMSEASKDTRWLVEHMEEINEKYKGKWIAIISQQVVGVGDCATEAHNAAQKLYPSKIPGLYLVSEEKKGDILYYPRVLRLSDD